MSSVPINIAQSESAAIPFRRRRDVIVEQASFQGRDAWIVKDPISLAYHRLGEREWRLFQLLDGRSSVGQLLERLNRQRRGARVTFAEIQRVIDQFYRAGLVIAELPGQSQRLYDQFRAQRRHKRLATVLSIFWIRFPGVDPDRFLGWLNGWMGWIFSRAAFGVWAILATTAALLLLVNSAEFQSRLPEFAAFFSMENIVVLAATLAGTKILHELGHGLACKRFGGECHSIGFMLLVFTPAMYCDTSDSWRLSNKWHRVVIGAAGIYVEIALAGVATFLWWFSVPGFFNQLCLNVMFLCSVSTIIFNANPLLRYDGYYILSDILEIPNLAQRGRQAVLDLFNRVVLGIRPAASAFSAGMKWFFVSYSFASFFYRWFIAFSIIWLLTEIFRPYGLQVIGNALAIFAVTTFFVLPASRVVRATAQPEQRSRIRPLRLGCSLMVIALLLLAFFLIPVPHRVACVFVVDADRENRLYSPGDATITEIVSPPGEWVDSDDVIVVLRNMELEKETERLKASRQRLVTRRESLRRRRAINPNAAREIPNLTARIEEFDRIIERRESELKSLTIRAARPGLVVAAPEVREPEQDESKLPQWYGTALSEPNLGALIKQGTWLGTVVDPHEFEAMLLIDQSSIEFVEEGQPVTLQLDEYPGRMLPGEITEVARVEATEIPGQLLKSFGGSIATRPGTQGNSRPMTVYYQAVATFQTEEKVLPGFRGHGRIVVGHASLGNRFVRWVRGLFLKR